MAVIAVRTDDGEELCSWVIEADPEEYRLLIPAAYSIEAVVQDALRKEQNHEG